MTIRTRAAAASPACHVPIAMSRSPASVRQCPPASRRAWIAIRGRSNETPQSRRSALRGRKISRPSRATGRRPFDCSLERTASPTFANAICANYWSCTKYAASLPLGALPWLSGRTRRRSSDAQLRSRCRCDLPLVRAPVQLLRIEGGISPRTNALIKDCNRRRSAQDEHAPCVRMIVRFPDGAPPLVR
jgi:hypothetical protein